MAVLYLEPDDEITAAAARLRAMSTGQVVLVVPAGSRIGTSRINFRLLARQAGERDLRLAAVSDDPQVRALSAAAGVPAFETVDAAERALAALDGGAAPAALDGGAARAATQPPQPAARTREVPPSSRRDDQTQVLSPPTEPRPPRAPGPPRSLEQVRARASVEPPLYEPEASVRRRRRSLVAPLLALLMLLTLVGLGAFAAYQFVPTAEITLRPRLIEVGPLSVTVVADPGVAVVDATAGLIPAQRVQIELSAAGEFEATGAHVSTTRASGTVRFRSENTVFEVPVPAGTVVSTADGIEFETTAHATVPRAVFNVRAGTVNVAVRAVRAGPRGNVAAGTITRLPESIAAALVSVRNPQVTSGGRRQEQPMVTQEDYDSALAELTIRLESELADALADPATTPRGLTLYAESARLGEARPARVAADVVDTLASSFDLAVAATATVLAVNEQLVGDVAAEQLRQRIPAGTTLFEPSLGTTHTPGVVRGGAVEFTARGVARSYRLPDRDELVAKIRGQPISEARAIMERYGASEIVIWPDFIDRVPDQLARINLIVQPPLESP